MRRLSVWRLEADVGQEATILLLRLWGQVEQVMEEAPGVVSEVTRDAVRWGAYRGVRKAGVEGQWELVRVEHRHGPSACPRCQLSVPSCSMARMDELLKMV